jgi:hypothetical protein
MNDLLSEMSADTAPDEDASNKLAAACTQLEVAEQAVNDCEALLKKAKKAYALLAENEVPDLMKELNVRDQTLGSGRKLELKTAYYMSLTGQYKEPAIKWLREINHETMIGNDLVIAVPKGKDNEVAQVMAAAEELGMSVKRTEVVHTGSFKALVKKRLEEGEEVPLETLGIHVADTAVLKKGK